MVISIGKKGYVYFLYLLLQHFKSIWHKWTFVNSDEPINILL